MKYKIDNGAIAFYNKNNRYTFPKYTSQLINWANQNAQGTRPRVVGQMSDLFPVFLETNDDKTLENWREWYNRRFPDALENATNKIYSQVQNLQEAIQFIDRAMVRDWVEDLVIQKTYNGLYLQQAILASLADRLDSEYRLATPEEESKGIDGFVGGVPYSVKPDTYKTMSRLSETIDVKMIFYTKTQDGLRIEVED